MTNQVFTTGLSVMLCGHIYRIGQKLIQCPESQSQWHSELLERLLDSCSLPLKHRSFQNIFTVPKGARIQTVNGPMPALLYPQPYSREISFRGLSPMCQGV